MKAGFYPKLAADGIRKNRRLYVPYILTCTGMVTVYYIMNYLSRCGAVYSLVGSELITSLLTFGSWVTAIFACIFLFYTNSFLIRRRKKEFGLYNVLGMGKRNIGRISFWESLITAALSIFAGLALGIALSKFAELGLVAVLRGKVDYTLSVSLPSIVMTVAVFGCIFILLFINSFAQIRFQSAVSLIKSESAGEKPPKGNWVLGSLGVLILSAAYYISGTIKDPVSAIAAFFIAVVMVIVATYLIMIAGSVLFCRILQKKKNYYYKPNHFVSVSSMAYRMKRNGAGLASICILVTMVLVIVSSTTSMYFGAEDSINKSCPREIAINLRMNDFDGISEDNINALQSETLSFINEYGTSPENIYSYRSISFAGLIDGSTVITDPHIFSLADLNDASDVYNIDFVPLSDYNSMSGADETLDDGEAIIYTRRGNYKSDTISFQHGNTFKIKKHIDDFVLLGDSDQIIFPSMVVIVPDLTESVHGLDILADYLGDRLLTPKWNFSFDAGISGENQIALCDAISTEWLANDGLCERFGIKYFNTVSREQRRISFFSLYGGIFYLGIILSIVFIIAAVLIIYYKQISEGYEDRSRFEIMKKVGMTERNIRKSINSQLLTVFFLPLAFAALHLIFAFPIISKLLLVFNLRNISIFALTTAISAAVFACFYTIVYRITSNAYYKIVNSSREGR